MKVTFKIVAGGEHSIEVPDSTTVTELKAKISEFTDRKDEQMFLILDNKILKDGIISSIQNIDKNVIQVLFNQKQTEPIEPSTESSPTSSSKERVVEESSAKEQEEEEAPIHVSSGTGFGRGFGGGSSDDRIISDDEKEKCMKELTDMGFPQSTAKIALHRTQWKVAEAATLLSSGEPLLEDTTPPTVGGMKDDLKLAEFARGQDGHVGPMDTDGAGFGRGFGGFANKNVKSGDVNFIIDDEVQDIELITTNHGVDVKLSTADKQAIDNLVETTQKDQFAVVEAYKSADRNVDAAVNLLMSE